MVVRGDWKVQGGGGVVVRRDWKVQKGGGGGGEHETIRCERGGGGREERMRGEDLKEGGWVVVKQNRKDEGGGGWWSPPPTTENTGPHFRELFQILLAPRKLVIRLVHSQRWSQASAALVKLWAQCGQKLRVATIVQPAQAFEVVVFTFLHVFTINLRFIHLYTIDIVLICALYKCLILCKSTYIHVRVYVCVYLTWSHGGTERKREIEVG